MKIPSNLMLDNREEYLKLIGKTSEGIRYSAASDYEQVEYARCKGHPLAYICIFGSNYVSVLDVITARRLLDITVGLGPLDIDINRRSLYAYVSNFFENTISAIDLRSNKTIKTVPVGIQPAGVKTSPDGRLVYVVHYGEPSVYVLDAFSLKKITEIPLPSIGYMIDITKDGFLAFVGLRNAAQVAVIDLSVNLVVKVIPAGAGTEEVKISPTNRHVFVSNEDGDSITPINIPLAQSGSPFIPSPNMPVGLAFTRGGRRLYCSNRQDRSVSLLDVFTHRELIKIPVGDGPFGLATAREERLLIVTNSYEDTASIIDIQLNQVTRSVVVGPAPAFLAVI